MATTDTPAVADPGEGALGMAYGVLARLFEEPDEERYRALQTGSMRTELETLLSRSPLEEPTPVPDLSPADEYETLCARFNDLFAVGYPDPPVPRYETAYDSAGQWDRVTVDLARAYDFFDLGVDENRRDHPDHLVIELEFAGYLARLAALEGEAPPRRARYDFLDRHLVPFAQNVQEAVAGEAGTGIYDDVSRLLLDVATADLASLEADLDRTEVVRS